MVRIFNSIVQHLSLLCCVVLRSFCQKIEVGTSWLLTIQAKAGIHAHGLVGLQDRRIFALTCIWFKNRI